MKRFLNSVRRWFGHGSKTGENIRTLLFALLLVMVFRSTVAAPYKIPTGSMIPTLKIGDRIFVSKLSYSLKLPFTNFNLTTWDTPKRGDVVVFKFPTAEQRGATAQVAPHEAPKDYIKRVVGIPGDRIEFRAGILYINGSPVKRQQLGRDELLRNVEGVRDYPEEYTLYNETISGIEHYVLHNRYRSRLMNSSEPIVVEEGHYFVMGDNRDNSYDSREWGFVPFENIRGRALAVFFSVRNWPVDIRWNRFGQVIH